MRGIEAHQQELDPLFIGSTTQFITVLYIAEGSLRFLQFYLRLMLSVDLKLSNSGSPQAEEQAGLPWSEEQTGWVTRQQEYLE